MTFVVMCFYHIEIYVAWHSDVGIGSSKYCVYRSSLEEFKENQESTFFEMSTGHGILTGFTFSGGEWELTGFLRMPRELKRKNPNEKMERDLPFCLHL